MYVIYYSLWVHENIYLCNLFIIPGKNTWSIGHLIVGLSQQTKYVSMYNIICKKDVT
jgi:hypothetical protein